MESKQLKGHGYVRKSKAAGLVCGIVLGAALFAGANSASANEVSPAPTPAPVTSAETPTPKAQNQAQESTVTVDEGLTDAANKAKAAGLTVEQETTKDLGTATTEQEAQKLEAEAKKDVAAQKAEIEKKTSDYAAAMKESEVNRKKLIDNLSENPGLYNMAGDQLRALADKDYDAGKASFGEFKSSNGTVRFLDAPNRVDPGKIDPSIELLNSKVISSPKEITTYYAGASMLGAKSFVSDKQNVKVVPMLVNDGETITYKVNYAADSKLGQLGVGYVEKSYTLKGSPVQSGKIALLADRYGTILENYVYGGLGKANDVIKPGQWGFTSSWTYYDKDGKKIDSKELAAKFVNKYWYPGLGLKATDIKLAPTTEIPPISKNYGDGSGTKDISLSFVNGGDSFFTSTRMYEELARAKNEIDPTAQRMSMSGAEVEPVLDTIVKIPTKQTVKYHLVSYKKSVKKTELPGDNATGSVEVHYVKDDAAKTVLKEPVTDTANAKVGSKYDTTDNKPKTITKDGKTYELVRTEGKETGEVVEGKIVVTYIYRETVKPTTIHVDGGGKELTPPEDGTKPFAKIPGYEPDPSNPRNNEDPKGVTVRVYKEVPPKPTPVPVNDPTTIHIDRDGKEIAPKEKGTKGFKKIPGYEADPTSLLNKEDPKGQSVRVYRKVEPKVDPKENPVTIHIDTEGKTVAPKEDGTKGFKEIPGYEKYPEDPKNVENVNGITVRVYKKLEDKPVQPTTPVEPAQPSPAAPATQKLNALPETGTATSILSVVGAALGGLGVVGLKSKKDEE